MSPWRIVEFGHFLRGLREEMVRFLHNWKKAQYLIYFCNIIDLREMAILSLRKFKEIRKPRLLPSRITNLYHLSSMRHTSRLQRLWETALYAKRRKYLEWDVKYLQYNWNATICFWYRIRQKMLITSVSKNYGKKSCGRGLKYVQRFSFRSRLSPANITGRINLFLLYVM